jgi:SAM-dependent methyltransferase
VLEVGSLDLNGSVRKFFSGCEYIGVDVAPGKGVDLVCEGQMVGFQTGHFDTVISCEAMEHNPYWVETTANMFRLCRPGGLVIISCATHGRPEHGTTRTNPADSPLTVGLNWDYYRNLSEKDFINTFPLERWFSSFSFFRNWNSYDLFFVGIRLGSDSPPHLTGLFAAINRQCAPKDQLVALRRKLLVSTLGDERLDRLRGILSKFG